MVEALNRREYLDRAVARTEWDGVEAERGSGGDRGWRRCGGGQQRCPFSLHCLWLLLLQLPCAQGHCPMLLEESSEELEESRVGVDECRQEGGEVVRGASETSRVQRGRVRVSGV